MKYFKNANNKVFAFDDGVDPPDGLIEITKQEALALAAPIKTIESVTNDIKAEASRRILAILPGWQQRNLLARGIVLDDKGRANWSTLELVEWDAGMVFWTAINVVRASSDTLEISVAGMTQAQLDALDVSDDQNWI